MEGWRGGGVEARGRRVAEAVRLEHMGKSWRRIGGGVEGWWGGGVEVRCPLQPPVQPLTPPVPPPFPFLPTHKPPGPHTAAGRSFVKPVFWAKTRIENISGQHRPIQA